MNNSLRTLLFCGIAAALGHPADTWAQGQDDYATHRGKLVEFDAPGAAAYVSNICGSGCGTFAMANSDRGVVVGYFTDEYVVPHAFIRTPGGEFIVFNAPGAGLGSNLNEGTVAITVNDADEVAGRYMKMPTPFITASFATATAASFRSMCRRRVNPRGRGRRFSVSTWKAQPPGSTPMAAMYSTDLYALQMGQSRHLIRKLPCTP